MTKDKLSAIYSRSHIPYGEGKSAILSRMGFSEIRPALSLLTKVIILDSRMKATVDYQTARNLLITQGLDADQHPDALLTHIAQMSPPIPGQVTSILLALKVVFEALRDVTELDRELAYSLYILASESRQYFSVGQQKGIEWPPLLDEDLARIASGVKSIFAGQWFE